MAEEGDLDIHYNGIGDIHHILIGLGFGGFGLFLGTRMGNGFPGRNDGFEQFTLFPILIGLGFIIYGAVRLFNNGRVMLSLTAEGLKDHRTGVLVRWTDFRGVRLYVKTTNGSLTSATMYVKVPHGDVDREVEFDVHSLDRSHDDIAQFVHKRGLTAIQSAATNPDAIIASIMSDIATDLEVGIPQEYVVSKLVKKGLDAEAAAHLVAEVAHMLADREARRAEPSDAPSELNQT